MEIVVVVLVVVVVLTLKNYRFSILYLLQSQPLRTTNPSLDGAGFSVVTSYYLTQQRLLKKDNNQVVYLSSEMHGSTAAPPRHQHRAQRESKDQNFLLIDRRNNRLSKHPGFPSFFRIHSRGVRECAQVTLSAHCLCKKAGHSRA